MLFLSWRYSSYQLDGRAAAAKRGDSQAHHDFRVCEFSFGSLQSRRRRICDLVFQAAQSQSTKFMMPNKSLQATRDGVPHVRDSASRFTQVGPACLSSGR